MGSYNAFPAIDKDGYVRLRGDVIGRVKRCLDGWEAVIGGGLVGIRDTRGQAVDLLRVRANRGRFSDLASDVHDLLSRLQRDTNDRHIERLALMSLGMLLPISNCSMEPDDALDLIYQAAHWAGLSPTFPRSASREVSNA